MIDVNKPHTNPWPKCTPYHNTWQNGYDNYLSLLNPHMLYGGVLEEVWAAGAKARFQYEAKLAHDRKLTTKVLRAVKGLVNAAKNIKKVV